MAFNPDAGHVMGDAGRLQQVLWNLLSNAVKFTAKGGQVYLELRRIDGHIEIAVRDTGQGILPEFLPRVFDRFAQQPDAGSGVSARKMGGLGLGLAIVKHIVEMHGGTVEVQSEGAGRGSLFIVRLPLMAVRASHVPAEPPHSTDAEVELVCPPEIAGLRVLLIDDETDSREVTRAVLERGNASVETACSVAEALERLRASKPQVIVSDIGMPGEDGFSFIQKLRALPREEGGRIPAVALTAFARTEDRRRALTAGFNNHAAKPIEPQELLIVIANLVGRYL
jgi:CheY-like chemotaxis protein/anti-sigma regulatory factor (Ser/Thr protein kinase)